MQRILEEAEYHKVKNGRPKRDDGMWQVMKDYEVPYVGRTPAPGAQMVIEEESPMHDGQGDIEKKAHAEKRAFISEATARAGAEALVGTMQTQAEADAKTMAGIPAQTKEAQRQLIVRQDALTTADDIDWPPINNKELLRDIQNRERGHHERAPTDRNVGGEHHTPAESIKIIGKISKNALAGEKVRIEHEASAEKRALASEETARAGAEAVAAPINDTKMQMAKRIRVEQNQKYKSDDSAKDAHCTKIQRKLEELASTSIDSNKEKVDEIKRLSAQKEANEELDKQEPSEDELEDPRTKNIAKMAAIDDINADALINSAVKGMCRRLIRMKYTSARPGTKIILSTDLCRDGGGIDMLQAIV